MKTASEQVKDLENTRGAKIAQMQAIADKSTAESRSMEDAEREECKDLQSDIDQIDADLVIHRSLAKFNASQAAPVNGTSSQSGSESRAACGTQAGPAIIIAPKDQPEKFKGQNFTRMVIAKAVADLEKRSQFSVAVERWGKTNPTLVQIIKANEVPGGGTGSGEWGSELVNANTQYTGDFIEFLYAATVYDKLPLHEIPEDVMIKGQDGEGTAYWVGESKAIPATTLDFFNVSLTPLKVAALAVVSNDLLRRSTPAAEQLVRNGLVKATAKRTDVTFISATAASAGVSPAGILQGVAPMSSFGTSANALRNDIKQLYAPFIAAGYTDPLWLVTTPGLAKSIQLMVNALGQTEFAGLGANGGMLLGDTVVTGGNVPGGVIMLISPSDVYRIGDDGVRVDLSKDAMIEQNTVPTGATDTPVAASATMVSMFQEDSTAIRVIRSINFAKRRASAVQWINDADYGATSS